RYEKLFKITKEDIVGKTDYDVFPKEASDAFRANDLQVLKSCGVLEIEETAPHDDGLHTYISVKFPLQKPDGSTLGVCGISTDITERKKAEERIRSLNTNLEKRTEQLAASNKELEAFSYSVSHDLRAPLRAIGGFSRILLEDYSNRLDSEGQRFLGIIDANTKQMGQLIDDLLAFSTICRNGIDKDRIEIHNLRGSVMSELLNQETERNVSTALKPLEAAYGDPSLIKQVFVNLISNALKFTRTQPTASLEIGAYPNGKENVYYVKDNGVGFD